LCAFSVFKASILNESSRSGETSAVIARSPSAFAAARRCRPFGVQKPAPSAVTAITGSRNEPHSSIFCASRLVCAGESSRWYQRLVKEKELALDLSGGLNYFGNEFDYTGPMIMTTRATYKPGHKGDELIREMDAVVADIMAKGITEKELADAKVSYRSNFYSQVEGSMGKAHLLSALALFRDDPQSINSLLTPFENVTAAQVKNAAAKYLVATNRTVIDRVPEAKPQPKTAQ